MDIKSKPKLGQWLNNNLYLSDEEKKLIITDYLSGDECKQDVYKRYTGYPEEHGKLIKWMRKFGIEDKFAKNSTFTVMSKKKSKFNMDTTDFENQQLQKRVEELEKQLKEAEMKAIAYSTMVDIAEKQFNIPIRKKYNTKPSK